MAPGWPSSASSAPRSICLSCRPSSLLRTRPLHKQLAGRFLFCLFIVVQRIFSVFTFFFFWLPEPEARNKHHKTGKLFQEINVEVDFFTSAIVLFLCNGLKIKKSPDTDRASVSSVTNITLLQFEVPYVKQAYNVGSWDKMSSIYGMLI